MLLMLCCLMPSPPRRHLIHITATMPAADLLFCHRRRFSPFSLLMPDNDILFIALQCSTLSGRPLIIKGFSPPQFSLQSAYSL